MDSSSGRLAIFVSKPIDVMKRKFCCLLLTTAAVLASPARAEPPPTAGSGAAVNVPVNVPVKVVFDTDMMSDIDDALALAMLHALQDRHEANLIAVTISTDDKWCASYVDLVDTFYRHPQIPVGIVHGGVDLRKTRPETIPKEPNYTQVLSERKWPDGTLVYPHRLIDGSQAPEAVGLLRKILAAQPDKSIVMIQVGFSTNFARLLESKADHAIQLSGRDLIQKKVRLLSVMAGNYADTQFSGKSLPKGQPEFNLTMDVQSAQKLFSDWPTPVVASGLEVGLQMQFPSAAIEQYFTYAKNHPIAETYRDYVAWFSTKAPDIFKWPHDHPTFDLTSVLYAVRPNANYFLLSKPGKITVLRGGGSRFEESEFGPHRYLILPDDMKAKTLEAMVMLASQPPAGGCPSMKRLSK